MANNDDKEYDLTVGNMRELLKLRQGKETIWHILGICGIFSDTFCDSNTSAYLQGKRAVGLEILQLMEDVDKKAFAHLILFNLDE